MILNRNREQVNEITLNRAEWCYFISENNTECVITNAAHKMIATKPLSAKRIRVTNEMKEANITIA